MSCGRDNHSLLELEKESETATDLLNLTKTIFVLNCISLDIIKNIVNPVLTEKNDLLEKIWIFRIITRLERKIIDSHNFNEETFGSLDVGLDDASIISKIEIISILNERSVEVLNIANTFAEQLDNLHDFWKETRKKWESEEPLIAEVKKMSRKERKRLVKLWRDRELIAAQEKIKFDDLKAEWDAGKGRLNMVVIECLRGVAELRGPT
ncbi:unnamed protein product [Orchesella dallaii]|uniref:Uncharacterized protein n=1 Tax=Orchesella dallaii TaxID=48710 RepID=A0ABP1S1A9_9HEXA